MNTGSANDTTEGRLVVVEGVITQAVSSDLPYGYKFYVDDGSGEIQIFVSASTGIALNELTAGPARAGQPASVGNSTPPMKYSRACSPILGYSPKQLGSTLIALNGVDPKSLSIVCRST